MARGRIILVAVSNAQMVIALTLKLSTTIESEKFMARKLKNIHPGEILNEEFLKPLGISAYRLARETGMPQTRVSDIVHERRAITADTALRLSQFFGNSAGFWLGLQNDFDLEEQGRNLKRDLARISRYEQFVSTGDS